MAKALRLYYFTKEQYALEAIRDERLKIARLDELNDPFEFLAPKLEAPMRKTLRDAKANWNRTHGLLCMSEKWSNPLLWGHYADSHKGAVLGFDVNPDLFSKVNYQVSRPVLHNVDRKNTLTEDDMEVILYTKFKDWAYEAEHRWVVELGKPDTVSDLYFQSWGEDLILRQVIVGARAKLTPKRLRNVLGKKYFGKVQTLRARPAYETYRVITDKLDKGWPQAVKKIKRRLTPGVLEKAKS